ncbi:MAG: response regulator transcription factor [Sedimenticola sp.]
MKDTAGEIETVFSIGELQKLLEKGASDIVLLDLDTKDLKSEDVRGLISANPAVSFFVFSAIPKPEEGVVMISAGARGYANRLMHPEVISQAVQVVRTGELWLGSELILHLIKGSAGTETTEKPGEEKLQSLTGREREIAELVARGESNKRIAYDLGITERTVKAHLSTIFKKTETRDRLQLALLVNGRRD